MNQFPPSPLIRIVSNFLKIHGDIRSSRCTTSVVGIFFKYFVWTPLGSRVKIKIHFFLLVHFEVEAVWYCPIICHWCSWRRWQIYRRCRWYWWQIFHGSQPVAMTPVVPVANLMLGSLILMAQRQICCTWCLVENCYWCRLYRCCTLTCEYLREYSKFRNYPAFIFRGLGVDDSWQNLKQKILWHCLFFNLKTKIFYISTNITIF